MERLARFPADAWVIQAGCGALLLAGFGQEEMNGRVLAEGGAEGHHHGLLYPDRPCDGGD